MLTSQVAFPISIPILSFIIVHRCFWNTFLLAGSAVTNLVLRITELSGPRILSGLGCRARVGGAASPSQALRPKGSVALTTSRATDRYEQPTSGYQRTRVLVSAALLAAASS